MNVTTTKIKDLNVLTIQDERIDAHNSAELKEYFLQMLDKGEIQIVVQLEHVRFIDSSGLGALLSGHKNAISKSGRFAIVNIQQQVMTMFEITRLNRVFEIYANTDEVTAALM